MKTENQEEDLKEQIDRLGARVDKFESLLSIILTWQRRNERDLETIAGLVKLCAVIVVLVCLCYFGSIFIG
jgi:hypothetical protein